MQNLLKSMLLGVSFMFAAASVMAAEEDAETTREQRRAEMRERWESMSEADRQAFIEQRQARRERWQSMSAEERQARRERWQSMSEEERRAMRERMGRRGEGC
jgi:hypothetical protein